MSLGALLWPTLRRHYFLHRLHADSVNVRLQAINTLAGLAIYDPAVAEPLVRALVTEAQRDDPRITARVDAIALWSIERATAVMPTVIASLGDASDERFLLLAGWLRGAGQWRDEHPALADQVRWHRLRLGDPNPATRLAALQGLRNLGHRAGRFLLEVAPGQRALTPLIADQDGKVRTSAVLTAATCLWSEGALQHEIAAALASQDPAVRREAVLCLGTMQADALASRPADPLSDPDPSVRAAALWAGAGLPGAAPRALSFLADAEPPLRRLAAWTLGVAPSDEGQIHRITHLLADNDPIVAARGAIALGRRGRVLEDISPLIKAADSSSRDLQLAALYALGRCAADRTAAITYLRSALGAALDDGETERAAAAVESLGLLGDDAYLPVMLDITEELHDQPMLQYAAALAAGRIDKAAGAGALLELCSSPTDEVRELAAFRLSRLDPPPLDRLVEALRHGGDPLRGGAALAMALSGKCELSPAEPLGEWLAERLDTASEHFEASWQIRTNYLCARLVCGDEELRQDLDVYLLNANVSRTGLMVTLLHRGERLALDMLFSPNSTVDAESFLRDARFIDVVSDAFPEAPTFLWQEDLEIRHQQVDALRRWWTLRRATPVAPAS